MLLAVPLVRKVCYLMKAAAMGDGTQKLELNVIGGKSPSQLYCDGATSDRLIRRSRNCNNPGREAFDSLLRRVIGNVR